MISEKILNESLEFLVNSRRSYSRESAAAAKKILAALSPPDPDIALAYKILVDTLGQDWSDLASSATAKILFNGLAEISEPKAISPGKTEEVLAAGLTAKQWAESWRSATEDRLLRAKGLSKSQDEPPSVSLTRLRDFARVSSEQSETVMKTVAAAKISAGQEATFRRSGVVKGVMWLSTLDGRTSSICQARDRKAIGLDGEPIEGFSPLSPPGVRPPAHPNCRSVISPVIDGQEIQSGRPFIEGKFRSTQSEVNKQAKADAKKRFPGWDEFSGERKRAEVERIRQEIWDTKVGRVDRKLSYDDWLRTRSREFQDDTLGKEKADLFRKGLTLDKFVDNIGKPISLSTLKAKYEKM